MKPGWRQAICPHCGAEFKLDNPNCPQCPNGDLCWCDVDGPDSFSCQLVSMHDGDCKSPYDDEWLAVREHIKAREQE